MLYAWDMAQGSYPYSEVSSASRGTGPLWGEASSMVLDQARGRLLVSGDLRTVWIDLATGNRTELSGAASEISLAGASAPRLWVYSATAEPSVFAGVSTTSSVSLLDGVTGEHLLSSY